MADVRLPGREERFCGARTGILAYDPTQFARCANIHTHDAYLPRNPNKTCNPGLEVIRDIITPFCETDVGKSLTAKSSEIRGTNVRIIPLPCYRIPTSKRCCIVVVPGNHVQDAVTDR